MSKIATLLLLGVQLVGLFGCDDLSEFKTGRGTVFRGEVVGSDNDPEQSSFIRKGFPSHTRMDLQFDPSSPGIQDDPAEGPAPGRVHTYTCPGRRECEPDDAEPGAFDRERLEPIENLTHDSLSEYTFPGGGRLRNYMFSIRFESQIEGADTPVKRNAMLFISLMDSGKIEVRAIAPSVLAADGETEQLPALFGVFVLERQSR